MEQILFSGNLVAMDPQWVTRKTKEKRSALKLSVKEYARETFQPIILIQNVEAGKVPELDAQEIALITQEPIFTKKIPRRFSELTPKEQRMAVRHRPYLAPQTGAKPPKTSAESKKPSEPTT